MDEETRIRERAYAIWEREGRPEGRHGEHWDQACRELAGETSVGGAAPGVNPPPGPDSGVQNPPSASEQHLREAADRMRSVEQDGERGEGQADPADRIWVTER